MRLMSTTLSNNKEDIIADALRSVVDHVDICILIKNRITDSTSDVAWKICGTKLREAHLEWDGDTSIARNFALKIAELHGADWAITLDTDERILWNGEEIRDVLANAGNCDTFMAYDKGKTYSKDRIIRVPSKIQWAGPVHEYFPSNPHTRRTLEKMTFDELKKTPEQLRQRLLFDRPVLESMTNKDPQNPRWWFYLAETLRALGEKEAAASTHLRRVLLEGWPEERACACYCLINYYLEDAKNYSEAVRYAMLGMTIDPGFAEFPWFAALASLRAGKPTEAIHFAKMALSVGHVPKTIFRVPKSWGEGPLEVLREAYLRTGDLPRAKLAEEAYTQVVHV